MNRNRQGSFTKGTVGNDGFSTSPKYLPLLRKYGFDTRRMSSQTYNEKVITKLNMRQLDGLKMLFMRNAVPLQNVSAKIREGIMRNDLRAFASALTYLSSNAAPEENQGQTKPDRIIN